MKVRLKKEIISLGRYDINPRQLTGDYISPKELYEMYENKKHVIVLDTRNEIELSNLNWVARLYEQIQK